jgi:hypothetical protein
MPPCQPSSPLGCPVRLGDQPQAMQPPDDAALRQAVIPTAGLGGSELDSVCRKRGLDRRQVARWRQNGEDPEVPTHLAWRTRGNGNARIRN